MNWGKKILLVYIVFVAGILFLVYKSSVQNQDLVTPDYYEQELKYQEKIDETERANALSTEIKFKVSDRNIHIDFPEEMKGIPLNAEVLLYCIADKSKDINKRLATEIGIISFDVPAENKGMHELKISWVANGISYYNQQKIFIQ